MQGRPPGGSRHPGRPARRSGRICPTGARDRRPGGMRMSRLVEETPVPKCEGRSWTVRAGQEVRVVAVEGPQAADLIAWNAADPRESMSSWLTRHMSGNFGRASKGGGERRG